LLSEQDKTILSHIQHNIPLVKKPFQKYAAILGISQEKLIRLISGYLEHKIIKRFAGVLNHHSLQFDYNAMVAIQVNEDDCDKYGEKLAHLEFISHCYKRTSAENWPYNLYIMIHALNKKDFDIKLSVVTDTVNYCAIQVLPSAKEFKKCSFSI